MIPLLFLIGLLVLAYLIHRSGRRGRKLNSVLEEKQDLQNALKIKEVQQENQRLEEELTKDTQEDISEPSAD